jgi:thymidine kinase
VGIAMKNNELVLFLGPMFSGKTTRLLAAIERHILRQQSVVCFKPKIDDRYSDNEIVTHSKLKIPAVSVKNWNEIMKAVNDMPSKPNVIAVDEAFMIEDCHKALLSLFAAGITIYVSSIDISANLNSFTVIDKLLPYSTQVVKCAAICASCLGDAQLTYRKFASSAEISVGGGDSYEPLCWSCHPLVEKKPWLQV